MEAAEPRGSQGWACDFPQGAVAEAVGQRAPDGWKQNFPGYGKEVFGSGRGEVSVAANPVASSPQLFFHTNTNRNQDRARVLIFHLFEIPRLVTR
jgi:hypothetical protein